MESGIVVIDVRENTSAEEAGRMLNVPGDSYFLVQVLPVSGGHRAYLRRYKTTTTKTQIAKANGDAVDDVAVLAVVRANRDKSVRVIVSLLEAGGNQARAPMGVRPANRDVRRRWTRGTGVGVRQRVRSSLPA